MTKIQIAKQIVGFVVGAGTATISRTIIKNNVDPEKSTNKVTVNAASVVIGAMATDATRKYTDAKIDEIVNWWETNVTSRLN